MYFLFPSVYTQYLLTVCVQNVQYDKDEWDEVLVDCSSGQLTYTWDGIAQDILTFTEFVGQK